MIDISVVSSFTQCKPIENKHPMYVIVHFYE